MSRRAFWMGLLLACMGYAMTTETQAQTALRVQLRVQNEADARLLERTRGQTSDLSIELSEYRTRAPLGSFAAAVTQAFTRCRESGADVVAWGTPARSQAKGTRAASWIVALASCKNGRVLARRIDGARPALGASDAADSGVLEAAALVLRGALSVLAQGGTLGVVAAGVEETGAEEVAQGVPGATQVATGAREPALAGAHSEPVLGTGHSAREPALAGAHSEPVLGTGHSAREPALAGAHSEPVLGTGHSAREPAASSQRSAREPVVGEQRSEPAPEDARGARALASQRGSRRSAISAVGQAGLQQVWDGAGALGRPALYAAAALGKRSFRLGLAGSLGFELTHRDAYTQLEVSRHTVAAQWRQSVWRQPDWTLGAGLDAGVVFYRRSTRALDAAAQSRPASLSPAAFASPWFTLGRRVGPLWISLQAALDLLPFVPRFVYRTQAGPREALQLWPVAPRLVVGLGIGRP